jgi:hypothetical protein
MEMRKILATGISVLSFAGIVAATDDVNSSWETFVNTIPWILLAITGIVSMFFTVFGLILALVVLGFVKDFLKTVLGMMKGAMR